MMMSAKRFFGISFGLALTLFSLSASVIKGEEILKENLLNNPSFEAGNGAPNDWRECQGNKKSVREYVTDGKMAHSGKCCVMIEGTEEGQDGAIWIPTPDIEVKGGTTYEFSAWAKSDGITGQGYNLDIWDNNGTAYIAHSMSPFSKISENWQKLTGRFTTLPTTKKVTTRLRLSGLGKVYFDDAALVEVPENKMTNNLLANSSFEFATAPGRPDYWGHWDGGLWGAHYAEQFFRWWKVDDQCAFHGKKSIKIYRPFNDGDAESKEYYPDDFVLYSTWFPNLTKENQSYTLSGYLKSDIPSLKVNIAISGGKNSDVKDVEVNTSWGRFVLTTPPLKNCESTCITIRPKQKGTVWIDAIQLEKGETATPYAPSQKDLVATGKEKLPAVPKIVAVNISHPPKIDGLLDDNCYAEIPKLDLVLINGEKPKEPTNGYIFQNGDNLYLGMKCYENQMDKVKTTVKDNDGPVWDDDSVEIFIDPELSKETYYRLGVNANGVRFDGKMLDNVWNGDWEAKTYRGKDFWSLEIKVPLDTFPITPLTGTTWGINLCRNNHVSNEYSCWSPVYTGFHNPKRFGEITGIDSKKIIKIRDNQLLVSSSSLKVTTPASIEVVPELNYYTDEKTASIFVLSNQNKDAIGSGKMTLSVELKDKEEKERLFSEEVPFSSNMISVQFPIGALKTGEYLILAKLTDAKGGVIGETRAKLFKLEKKANEVKINRMNRMLVIDGKPLIMFGQNWAAAEGNPYLCRKVLRKLSESFNYVTWSLGQYDYKDDNQINKIIEFLDMVHENNLRVNPWYFSYITGKENNQEAIKRLVPKIKDHPALLCWPMLLDEINATEETNQLLQDKYTRIKEIDPYHPIYTSNHSASLNTWEKFGTPGDIVELHDYAFGCPWLNGVSSWEQSVEYAGAIARESRRPFHAMPQTFDAWASWTRGPSAAETEASTYLALVHGATMIEYYSRDQSEAEVWRKVRTLGKEIKELTPILASYESVEVGVGSSKIHTLTKKYFDQYYLIAINASEEAIETGFDLSSLQLPENFKVKVMFENRNIELPMANGNKHSPGIFRDTFAGYQRHVYRVGSE